MKRNDRNSPAYLSCQGSVLQQVSNLVQCVSLLAVLKGLTLPTTLADNDCNSDGRGSHGFCSASLPTLLMSVCCLFLPALGKGCLSFLLSGTSICTFGIC